MSATPAIAPGWLLGLLAPRTHDIATIEVVDQPDVVAFADTGPSEQRRRNALQTARVARITTRGHEMKRWAAGYRPDGVGWEKGTADIARDLLGMVASSAWPLTMQEAQALFIAAAPTDSTWTRADAIGKWRSEARKAQPAPMPQPEPDWMALDAPVAVPVHVVEVESSESEPEADPFWDERPVLAHARDYARARMASPWAVLGVALVLASCTVPPNIVLPPTVGGVGSLNMFVGLVGPSGGGKGAAEAAARDAFDFGTNFYWGSIGSGEGLAHLLAHRERGEVVRDRDTVVLTVPEVDNFAALGARQGATLLPAVRSAWSAERLGFGYADPSKRVPIEPHTYRMGLVVGVQPARAGTLLDDSDGGTPQRFLWLPVLDRAIPDQTPPEPERWGVPVSPWPRGGQHRMAVPDEAVETMRAAARDRHRGEVDALDGHALLCRLKVAAALAVLDGRHGITEDDWRLAGDVMARSDATRAAVVTELRQARERTLLTRAKEAGTAADVAHVVQGNRAALRLASTIAQRLSRKEPTAWSDLRRALASRDRPFFEDAVALLVQHQWAELVEGSGGGRSLVATGRGRPLPRVR